VSREQGAPTMKSQADARQAELETGVRADPIVKAVLERFPGAEIVDVRRREEAASETDTGEGAIDDRLSDERGEP